MPIYESAENYLETILMLKNKNGSVRSIDIVNELGYSKPSVSRAMKLLGESEYIVKDENGYIKLTEKGHQVAECMLTRHTILSDFLISLGVKAETAAEDACRIEHIISQESFDKICELLAKQKK
ncbi:MAG: metal-dependent transcriptional regulator [Bacillota bacterium]|nr:metal-dependent transcriptional regulator [Bacillota bacterium]